MVITLAGRCSFCEKAANEVQRLAGIAPRLILICNECIDLCQAILQDDSASHETERAPAKPFAYRDEMSLTKDELEAMLQAFQEPDAKTIKARQERRQPQFICSFCTCRKEEGEQMIAGPSVYICERCIGDAAALLCLPA